MKRAINTFIEADWDKERDLGLTKFSRWLLSDTKGADHYICVRRIRIQTGAPSSSVGWLVISFKDPLNGFAYMVESPLSDLKIFNTISRVSTHRTEDFFGPCDDAFEVTFRVPQKTPFTSGAMKVLRMVIDVLGVDPKGATVKCTQETFVRMENGKSLDLGTYLKQRFLECAAPEKAPPASWI